jgi:hypothetical protein
LVSETYNLLDALRVAFAVPRKKVHRKPTVAELT